MFAAQTWETARGRQNCRPVRDPAIQHVDDAADRAAPDLFADEKEDEDEEEEDQGPSGPDPEVVDERFEELAALYKKFIELTQKHGPGHKQALKLQEQMAHIFLRIKYPAKMVDHLVDRLRFVVSQTRDLERMILQMAVLQAKMPKSVFMKSFLKNEADTEWLTPILKGKQKWVPALAEYEEEIRAVQEKLGRLERETCLTIAELKDIEVAGGRARIGAMML